MALRERLEAAICRAVPPSNSSHTEFSSAALCVCVCVCEKISEKHKNNRIMLLQESVKFAEMLLENDEIYGRHTFVLFVS